MGQIPFVKILIPIISGILLYKSITPSSNLFFISCAGLLIILLSFLRNKHKMLFPHSFFGVGCMLLVFSLTIHYCHYRVEKNTYTPPQTATSYLGKVIDLPQPKKRSVACEIQLTYPLKTKVMLYFEPDTNSALLLPGDEVLIHARIQPFKNLGNPDEFDYKQYMQRKGFAGSAYVTSANWLKTGRHNTSIKTKALLLRAHLLKLYKSFGLDSDAYSFISAVTLGYKADLSDELKSAFRASGTSHILAVSGLHVGIIYVIILTTFSFLGTGGKRHIWFVLKQLLVLLCLWIYVFLTGMPLSVIRAAVMLSMVSVGSIINKKGLTYNTLAIAAFILLLINPLYLFDVGFQLSFVSVGSILFFQPKLYTLFKPKSKQIDYIWTLFTVSLSAQLGVFPLVLYYFGAFPTYFFITNLLILPFIAIIIYSTLLLTLLSFFLSFNLMFVHTIYRTIVLFTNYLISAVLYVIRFFETMPLSELKCNHISAIQVGLLFSITLFFMRYVIHHKAKQLIVSLSLIAILLFTYTHKYLNPSTNQFVVYNSYSQSKIGYIIDGENRALPATCNQVVAHPSANIVLLSENKFNTTTTRTPLFVDILILASDNSFSVTQLLSIFQPELVVIDPSISLYRTKQIIKECQLHNLSYHDISNSGALLVNF